VALQYSLDTKQMRFFYAQSKAWKLQSDGHDVALQSISWTCSHGPLPQVMHDFITSILIPRLDHAYGIPAPQQPSANPIVSLSSIMSCPQQDVIGRAYSFNA
jgi:hypothetical protein